MTRFILGAEVHHTLEIKKSQFITRLVSIDSREQAMTHLQQAKLDYPDARHHCWAYVMGDSANSQTAAMSDDGEPSGTAGKPMLNVLQHKPVNNVLAIVIRYFGGIKLGAGGLVRAYSQAVEQAFSKANLIELVPQVILKATVDFSEEQWLRHHCEQNEGQILNTSYSNQVEIKLQLPTHRLAELSASLDARSIRYNVLED